MNENKTTGVLVIAMLVLSVVLFAAVQYKKGNVPVDPNTPVQNPNEWENWQQPQKPRPQQPNTQQPEVIPNTPRNYQEALSIAKRTNKRIFLYFHADNCRWCEKMKNDTLNDTDVQRALSDYVVYYVNRDRESVVARKYNVSSVPVYIVIDANEKVQKKGIGYKGEKTFLMWLNARPDRPDNRRPDFRPGPG